MKKIYINIFFFPDNKYISNFTFDIEIHKICCGGILYIMLFILKILNKKNI